MILPPPPVTCFGGSCPAYPGAYPWLDLLLLHWDWQGEGGVTETALLFRDGFEDEIGKRRVKLSPSQFDVGNFFFEASDLLHVTLNWMLKKMFCLTVFWLQGLVFTGDTLFVAGLGPWNFGEKQPGPSYLSSTTPMEIFQVVGECLKVPQRSWVWWLRFGLVSIVALFFSFVCVFFCCPLLGKWHLFIMLLVTASFGLWFVFRN